MMGVFVQINENSRRAKREPVGYVIQENGCWQWVGFLDRKGYGRWSPTGRSRAAHRMMYERARGPIPNGLTIDHLCRNTGCVNPDHLEAVTNTVNVLRGEGHTARNARKTHCNRGHILSGVNLYTYPNGRRQCRACMTVSQQNRRPR